MCKRAASASGPEYVLTMPTSLYLHSVYYHAPTCICRLSLLVSVPVRDAQAEHLFNTKSAPFGTPATLALLACAKQHVICTQAAHSLYMANNGPLGTSR